MESSHGTSICSRLWQTSSTTKPLAVLDSKSDIPKTSDKISIQQPQREATNADEANVGAQATSLGTRLYKECYQHLATKDKIQDHIAKEHQDPQSSNDAP